MVIYRTPPEAELFMKAVGAEVRVLSVGSQVMHLPGTGSIAPTDTIILNNGGQREPSLIIDED